MSTTPHNTGSRSVRVRAITLLFVLQLALAGAGGAFSTGFAQPSPALEVAGGQAALDDAGRETARTEFARRSLQGRHRLELSIGYWDTGRRDNPLVEVHNEHMTRVEDLVGAFSYAYWFHDQVATDITLRGLAAEVTSIEAASTQSDNGVFVTSMTFGVRLYPLSSAQTPLRPYVSAGAGPYLGIHVVREVNGRNVTGSRRVDEDVKTLGSFGGYLGGGVDVQFGRHLMAGFHVAYNLMDNFAEPIGLERNYDGVAVTAGLSVLFGKGSVR